MIGFTRKNTNGPIAHPMHPRPLIRLYIISSPLIDDADNNDGLRERVLLLIKNLRTTLIFLLQTISIF